MCDTITVDCGKCNGKGYLREYNHIAGGTCFACKGRGNFTYTLKQYEAKEARKRKQAEQKLIERQQKQKEYAELMYNFTTNYSDHPEFKRCMASCPSEEYYEMHLQNTYRFMKSRGLITV